MLSTPILIIDDEPSLREGIKEFLEDEGYDVHLAANGNEGLSVFQELKPDLVVTDLRMPGISGMEVIREIKNVKQNASVIVITGYGSMEAAVDAIRLDVFDFITKPIDLDQLKKTLERAQAHQETAQNIQNEMDSLREQLLRLHHHINKHEETMFNLEPLVHAGRLLAGILHNLNNPLTYIMGQTQLLQLLHPEVVNLEKIQEQAVRMDTIITTILNKIRQSQNREKRKLQLNDILKEEVLFMESDIYFKHEIDREWHLSHDLPLFEGVAGDFAQVFGNLLRNATDAMRSCHEELPKRLTITTRHDKAGIHISIQDTGPGIPKSIREKIFQPFFSTKAEKSRQTGRVWMGLGLHTCKETIRRYGGSIELKSQPGRGACFTIHLPG